MAVDIGWRELGQERSSRRPAASRHLQAHERHRPARGAVRVVAETGGHWPGHLVRCPMIPMIPMILDDEDRFAAFHQPEIAARRLFERVGIVPQPPVLFAHESVRRLQAFELAHQLVVLVPAPLPDDHAAVADDRVDEDDRSDQEEQQMHDAPCPRAARALCDVWRGRPLLILRHLELRHYNSFTNDSAAKRASRRHDCAVMRSTDP